MPSTKRFKRPTYLSKAHVEDMTPKERGFEPDHITVEVIAREERLVLYSEQLPHPWPLNTVNIEALEAIYGTDDFTDWRGKQLEIYIDDSVQFGDRRVGGLRVRAAK